MTTVSKARIKALEQRLSEAEETIRALLSGEIDAVVDAAHTTPVLLSNAQAELRESELRYRSIVETAHEGITIVDSDGTISFTNGRFAEMLGYTVDELVGQSLFKFVPSARQEVAGAHLSASRQKASQGDEVAFIKRDGTELWALLRTAPVRDGAGHYIGTLGMTTDRTRARQAEEARRKSEAQYRLVVESTTDGVIHLDADNAIVFVNRRLAEMLGREPAEMLGMSLFDLLSPESQARTRKNLQLRKQGSKEPMDNVYRHRDGTDIPVSISGTGLFDEEGRYVGTLGIVRDVTERNKLQSQLMVSDRMASIGTLAAGVAHEINNPLAAVVANLDFIAESLMENDPNGPPRTPTARGADWLRNEIRTPLVDAQEAARRMRFIVRDLKVFASAPGDAPPAPVDVEALMDATLRMADNEIRHRARVIKQYGAVPSVQARAERLGQVFLNLLVNAAQALPDGQAKQNQIRVTTRFDAARVIIEVADTGPGIAPENLNRIFDAFFTTKEVGSGTGLGLAISYRIVADLGGELSVESVEGRGATFRVSLPIGVAPDAVASRPSGGAEPAKLHGRLLLVDDEPFILRIVKLVLGKDHEIVSRESAVEALALITAGERFDLILCDLMMPQMSGEELHGELVRVAPDQAQRMIFLTGGAFTPTAQQFLADRSIEYIEKPFDSANLRAIVQRHLRGTA
ncbi:MAG: PAS domain S-box protein [Gemmatimonadaceae bacterium]|nr:PAS domain S-box protein [Gemmatimonadaceae bacterium]